MKTSNYIVFSIYFLSIVVLLFSCKDDDQGGSKIEGWDYFFNECTGGQNYMLNEEGTACVCPEGTHYKLPKVPGNPEETTLCVEIDEGSFLYKADIRTCLYEVRDTSIAVEGYQNVYDAIGIAEFDFVNKSLYLVLGTGQEGERFSLSIFGASAVDGELSDMTFHEDGSFSVVYHGIGNWEKDCLDWAERSPDCAVSYVTTSGRSNPERTKIDLEMRWTDCFDNLLDVGRIEMWKEW